MKFKLKSKFEPKGDQPEAIEKLSKGICTGKKEQVLLGVTGSGKTFSMANVIQEVQRPTLIMAPNKTLAAQLYGEFKELFPDNVVEYFVSYYDYYQPEAYVPTQDLYIEKDASINETIDKLRHSATHSLLTRKDVIIIASVSCIYGLGSPEEYYNMLLHVDLGQNLDRNAVLEKLVTIQYARNDTDFYRGTFRVRGDIVEVFPAYESDKAIRIEWFGNDVERISEIDPLTGKKLADLKKTIIFPNSHYVTSENVIKNAIKSIRKELEERVKFFKENNKLLEAQRIEQRTKFDLEMMEEIGFCKGIENYSRYLTGRKEGEAPPTLLDYFPDDYLLFIDESHIGVSQISGMYKGDRARKTTLVEYGFRLPSALDNRPLCFDEFEDRVNQIVYVSATPADYELQKTNGEVVEQLVRPTGLIDPEVEVRSAKGQVDNLFEEIKARVEKSERVLVTTLTKRMAEDLTKYYQEQGLKVRYMHSDIDTLERIALLRDLRKGVYDVLIGINLLREGLDIPEVSLVAILDADKEGFLRSERSLIQTFGRAARNVEGRVVLYADKITGSMRRAMDETDRRREKQLKYNKKHNITPETIKKDIRDIIRSIYEQDYIEVPIEDERSIDEVRAEIKDLTRQMLDFAKNLEFEEAASKRDQIKELEDLIIKLTR